MEGGKGLRVKRIGGRLYLYQRTPYWDKERGRKSDEWKYLGRCDENGNLLRAASPRVDTVHSAFPVGALAVFWAAAQELDVLGVAERSLGSDEAARLTLALALNQVAGRRPLDQLPEWVGQGPVASWLRLDAANLTRADFEGALSTLCHRALDGTTMDQGLVLQQALTRAWRGGSREPAQYYYDVTKVLYHGSHCELAEKGYYPGGTHKPVVGFGLVTSKTHHHPVLCRAIPGSRHDTLTVQDTVNTLEAFGLHHLTLIMDRGMVSQPNVEFLVEHGYDQVGLVPESHTDAWDYLARHAPDAIEQARHIVARPSGALYARAWSARLMGRKMRLAVAVDPLRRAHEQSERDLLLAEASTTTDPVRLRDIRHALGTIAVPAQGRRGWAVDEARAKEDRMGDGRFLVFSTDLTLTAEEMVRIYFQRESIEHAFRTFKSDLSLGPLRYRRPDRLHAYSTLIYIAWLLWSWAERRLREKWPTMSLHKALETLESLHLVRFGDEKQVREWTTRPTDEQSKILKHLKASTFLRTGPGG